MQEYLLEMQEITKVFPGVKALDNVDLTVKTGEIHALVGENGAGKSTLIKILSGVYPHGTYSGKIIFEGKERQFSNINEVEKTGIACIHQELNLCPDLSIAENIFLNKKPGRFGIVDFNEMYKRTAFYQEQVGFDVLAEQGIKPQELIRNLGIGQKQLVEIAKALSKEVKLLILDEPTSALTETEIERLFNILNEFRKKGVTCIYISHKLDEVMRLADTVTVLRDGQAVQTSPIGEITKDKLISLMVGRTLSNQFPREPHQRGELAMQVKNYSVAHPDIPGKRLIDDVNFDVYKGEILGISGLMGAGRTELMTSIYGAFHSQSIGEIIIDGKLVKIESPADALRNGIFLVSEDRKRYGLNLIMSVKENTTMSALKDFSTKFLGILNENKEIEETNKLVDAMHIKTPTVETLVQNLSGGNQQKVVVSKALISKTKIIILDEPTRGIDVGAKYEMYKIMNGLIDQGVAIIMISSEMEEILGMSDRILVMSEGKMTSEMDFCDATQEKIMAKCTGGK